MKTKLTNKKSEHIDKYFLHYVPTLQILWLICMFIGTRKVELNW